MDTRDFLKMLQRVSTDKYFIEYATYRSNHLGQGMIALSALGANEQRIQRFVDWYVPRLENSEGHPDASREAVTHDNRLLLRGQRRNFFGLVDYYSLALRHTHDGSLAALLEAELPELYLGVAGSALHALIELGYGLSTDSGHMVCQGLAYLNHSYTALRAELPPAAPSRHLLDVLKELRDDSGLKERVSDGIKLNNVHTSKFQKRMRYLLEQEAAILCNLSAQIDIPLSGESSNKWESATDWLLGQLIFLYTSASSVNDFFPHTRRDQLLVPETGSGEAQHNRPKAVIIPSLLLRGFGSVRSAEHTCLTGCDVYP